MSDRFVLHAGKKVIEELFNVSSQRDDYFEEDYNITPASLHPIIVKAGGKPQLQQAQWGLIPPDADEEREGKDTFAVPAEDVSDDGWFAECLAKRRCLVPANGFYKWKSSKKKTTPFYIRLLSNRLSAFAGLYSIWKSPTGRDVYSFTILTTKANTLVEPVDDRMPVMLGTGHFDEWLGDDELSKEAFKRLALEPFDLTQLAVNRVSEKVNNINNNGPELIQPIPK